MNKTKNEQLYTVGEIAEKLGKTAFEIVQNAHGSGRDQPITPAALGLYARDLFSEKQGQRYRDNRLKVETSAAEAWKAFLEEFRVRGEFVLSEIQERALRALSLKADQVLSLEEIHAITGDEGFNSYNVSFNMRFRTSLPFVALYRLEQFGA